MFRTKTRNRKNERGAVIMEASICLPVFMFFMFTLLSVTKIVYVQAKISVALDRTAKQLSEYSNIYYAMGMGDIFSGEEGKSSGIFNEVAGYLADIGSLFHSDTIMEASAAMEGDSVTKYIKHGIGSAAALSMTKSNVVGPDGNFKAFAKKNKIENINMGGTMFLQEGREVFLQINYDVKVLELLPIKMTYHLSHASYCTAWSGTFNLKAASEEES